MRISTAEKSVVTFDLPVSIISDAFSQRGTISRLTATPMFSRIQAVMLLPRIFSAIGHAPSAVASRYPVLCPRHRPRHCAAQQMPTRTYAMFFIVPQIHNLLYSCNMCKFLTPCQRYSCLASTTVHLRSVKFHESIPALFLFRFHYWHTKLHLA